MRFRFLTILHFCQQILARRVATLMRLYLVRNKSSFRAEYYLVRHSLRKICHNVGCILAYFRRCLLKILVLSKQTTYNKLWLTAVASFNDFVRSSLTTMGIHFNIKKVNGLLSSLSSLDYSKLR